MQIAEEVDTHMIKTAVAIGTRLFSQSGAMQLRYDVEVHTHAYIHTCIDIYIYIYLFSQSGVAQLRYDVEVHIHAYIHIYTQTCTHDGTHSFSAVVVYSTFILSHETQSQFLKYLFKIYEAPKSFYIPIYIYIYIYTHTHTFMPRRLPPVDCDDSVHMTLHALATR
jgi:hypothetical protein